MASQSPLDHHRPLNRSLEHNILRGEYVDLSLLFPDYCCSSPPGPIPSVSARGLVLKLRAYPYHHGTLIDSFQKWLDAYTTLILVVVRAYPCTAVELINICRSSAVRRPNFKGLPSSITTSSFAVPPPTSCPWIGVLWFGAVDRHVLGSD